MNKPMTAAPYYQSLNQPILIWGIDRSLLFLMMGLSLPIAFSDHLKPLMDLISVLVFLFLYSVSVILTRSDPYFISFYLRHLRYESYYLAQPNLKPKKNERHFSVPVFSQDRDTI